VADLARDKNLPKAFLSELGVVEEGSALRITYRLADGTTAPRQRIRTALAAKDGSIWTKGTGEVVPYGLWRLDEARRQGYLVLVEGESDCWTLWHHGIPALGIPGADMTSKLRAEYLAGIPRLLAVHESDHGGETFIAGTARQLKEIDWAGTALMLRLPNAKDPNELHQRVQGDSEEFLRVWKLSVELALPLPAPPPKGDEQARIEQLLAQAHQELGRLQAEEANEASMPPMDWKAVEEVLQEALQSKDPIAALDQTVVPALAKLVPIALDDATFKVSKAYGKSGYGVTLKTLKKVVQDVQGNADQVRQTRRARIEELQKTIAALLCQSRHEAEKKEGEERKSQATVLVELAQDAELWHTPEGEPYATIPSEGHRENWPLNIKGFRRWLARRFFDIGGKAPGAQAIQDAITVLEGQAIFDGSEHPARTRVAGHGGNIYLDLGNETWEAVEITPEGWRVLPSPPVRFRRSRGMLPLPKPVRGGSLGDLRPFVNAGSEEDWVLMAAWLVAAIRPIGPYPVLLLEGEQGSAKSTTGKVLRALVDPNLAPLRTVPRDERDLMIAARNGWVVGYDNLSGIPLWLSDAICRLSTGGGFSTRELYSDTDETLIDVQRPVIINGIDALVDRGDLQDRAIPLVLPQIPSDSRRDEKVFWEEFGAIRPRLLGGLLDVVSAALGRADRVRPPQLPRMADFVIWITAAEPALGWPAGFFLNAYLENQRIAIETLVEQDPVAQAMRDLAESGEWVGTATELLEKLSAQVGEANQKAKIWPKSPKALSNRLRRVAPSMRAVGVQIDFWREETHARRRLLSIRLNTQSTVHTVHTVHKNPETQDGSGFIGRTMSTDTSSTTVHHRPQDRPSDDPTGLVDDPLKRSSTAKAAPQADLDDADDADGLLRTHSKDMGNGRARDEEASLPLKPPSPSRWQVLADSGLHHNEVVDHAEVLFLSACELVRDTAPDLLPVTWERYALFWQRRMPREAFVVVEWKYRERLGCGPTGP
jgi:hypothetical protein